MKAVAIVFLLIVSTSAIAQNSRSTSSLSNAKVSERIFYGLGGGFNAGTAGNGFNYFAISVTPMIAYRLTEQLSGGAFIMYQTVRYPSQKVHLDQYGVAPMIQYRVNRLFAHAEYQLVSVPTFDNVSRSIYKRFPLGLGYTAPTGSGSAFNVFAAYDVFFNRATSPFGSPWVFRIYITFGGVPQ